MKFDKSQLRLYAVTDRSWLFGESLVEQVKEAIEGGVTMIQLREKTATEEEFLTLAKKLKELTSSYSIPFLINDEVDIALACEADGIHVGQRDMQAGKVRERIGPNKILGVSVQTVEQAIRAEQNGADYLGVGAVFSTSTKLDADTVSFSKLKEICERVSIPVVAIGGISAENVKQLAHTKIAGVAVVSAIFAQKDKKHAAHELFCLTKEVIDK